ncbi:MAG: hypothetical protein M1839_009344 [Geoglossum umbratile]|nr:MAG: hypothetical protein M1839_009344 [Geoglossum umbratile]
MEPVSIVGLTASTISLLRLLGQGVLSVKAMLHGIRDVGENTRGFGEELDAFHFSLSILDFEIRNGSMIPAIQGWWGKDKLDALLVNARKSFLRLEIIFHHIHRQRSILRRPREYARTNLYDQEISHLRLRINTYTSAFNIPVVLLVINGTKNPSTQADQSLNLSLLGDRISRLEGGITDISNGIKAFNTRRETNESTGSPQAEFPVHRESEELVEIARTLVSNASSVAASESTQSTASTVRHLDPASPLEDTGAILQQESSGVAEHASMDDGGHSASYSVTGVPLTTQRRVGIESWIPQPREGPSDIFPDDLSSMPDIASFAFAETSTFSEVLHTPPNTINSQDDSDIEAELIKRRYKRAIDLMEQQKYQEAIPHLKRTLGVIQIAGEIPAFQDTRAYQRVQYLLAVAFVNTNSNLTEAEATLQGLIESPESEPLEKPSAAHLLAQLYLNRHPSDCIKAKTMCLMAVKGRDSALGRTHPETYQSIELLCSICQASNDSDEEIWRDMLPEDFGQHKKGRETRDSLPLVFANHSTGVEVVAFSPDGKLVVSVSSDRAVIWDAASGMMRHELVLGPKPLRISRSPEFSPDSRLVAIFWRGTARLWDTATGMVPCVLTNLGRVICFAFSPDSQLFVSGSTDGMVKLWDTATGTIRQTLAGRADIGSRIAFSPDSRLVMYGSPDLIVNLWDTTTGRPHRKISISPRTPGGEASEARPFLVTFSPDKQLVLSTFGDGTVRLWDIGTGTERFMLTDHPSGARRIPFSPDSQLVACVSSGEVIGLWDTTVGTLRHKLPSGTLRHESRHGSVHCIKFSPDNQLIASAYMDGTAKLWDTATGTIRCKFKSGLGTSPRIEFSPDGRLLASWSKANRNVELWDTAAGMLYRTLTGHSDEVCCIAFSPDSQLIASGSKDNTARLWATS